MNVNGVTGGEKNIELIVRINGLSGTVLGASPIRGRFAMTFCWKCGVSFLISCFCVIHRITASFNLVCN